MNIHIAIERMLRKRPKARAAWHGMTLSEQCGVVRLIESNIEPELRTPQYLRWFAPDVAALVEAGR